MVVADIETRFGILDQVPVGMCLVNHDLTILLWNRCLEDWTGVARDQLLGQSLLEFFPHLNSRRFTSRLRDIFEGGPPTIFSSQLHRYLFPCKLSSGEYRSQHTTVSAVRTDKNDGYYALFAIQDVSDLTRLVHSGRETNAELEAFTYSVSHDLRAPLRSIDGFGEALEEDCGPSLDDTGREYLKRMRHAARRMSNLIDDLLHLSRVARRDMRPEPVDLSAMAAQISQELERTDSRRNVDWRMAPGLVVQGDKRLLRVAMENLLGNAWKFTCKRDCAKIEFGALGSSNRAPFFVRDNGAGFDMAYAKKLFEVFQRLHSNDEFEGTGIGLATVQRIIRRHGGKIWAEAKPNEGATFFFSLQGQKR